MRKVVSYEQDHEVSGARAGLLDTARKVVQNEVVSHGLESWEDYEGQETPVKRLVAHRKVPIWDVLFRLEFLVAVRESFHVVMGHVEACEGED